MCVLKAAGQQFKFMTVAGREIPDLKLLMNLLVQLFESQKEEILEGRQFRVLHNFSLLVESDWTSDEGDKEDTCSEDDDQQEEIDTEYELFKEIHLLENYSHWAKLWRARCQRWHWIEHQIEEFDLMAEIKNAEDAEVAENLTNFEVLHHLEDTIDELFKKMEEWDDKITADTDSLDASEQELHQRRKNFEARKKRCHEAFEQRKLALAEKDAAIERERILMIMAKAALRIQAWWRGTMVRKGLGRFKKKKSKKKKKATKKKKKK